jgi:hypothetical protein
MLSRSPTIASFDLDEYTPISDAWTASGKFSHDDTHIVEHNSKTQYFVKGIELSEIVDISFDENNQSHHSFDITDHSLKVAVAEVVGQEILRKFLPDTQPKYGLGITKSDIHRLYIMSERVHDFEKLEPKSLETAIFGKLSVICLFLGETDFKIGNLAQDKSGRPVKIDGDWLLTDFSGRRRDGRHLDMHPKAGRSLPLLDVDAGQKPFNWGDQYKGGVLNLNLTYFKPSLAFNADVIKGIVEGFEEIKNWKEEDIKSFVSQYIFDSALASQMSNLIIERKHAMEVVYENYLQERPEVSIMLRNASIKTSPDSFDVSGVPDMIPDVEVSSSGFIYGTFNKLSHESEKFSGPLRVEDISGISPTVLPIKNIPTSDIANSKKSDISTVIDDDQAAPSNGSNKSPKR